MRLAYGSGLGGKEEGDILASTPYMSRDIHHIEVARGWKPRKFKTSIDPFIVLPPPCFFDPEITSVN